MSSSAAPLVDERAARNRARAAERGRRYRLVQRQEREQMHAEIAASRGLISWSEVPRHVPVAVPDPPRARGCQWIVAAGGFGAEPVFCDEPCQRGRSYCSDHARVVFATAAARG